MMRVIMYVNQGNMTIVLIEDVHLKKGRGGECMLDQYLLIINYLL